MPGPGFSVRAGLPEFEEREPVPDCPCPGCAAVRRETARSPGESGHRPCGVRRALVLAAATGTVVCAAHPPSAAAAPHDHRRSAEQISSAGVRADDPGGSPQGGQSGLYGSPGRPADGPGTVTRAEIIERAEEWVAAKVPYSMDQYYTDGYRQDCSGFVSMAWNLGRNEWTGSLDRYAVRIERDELRPGDILLFHNPADPQKGSHVTIFGGWTDATHAYYLAYEQARPHARKQDTPYAYWNHAKRYTPYRYKNLRVAGEPVTGGPAEQTPRYPGAAAFGPGAKGPHITQLGRLLVRRGGAPFYRSGPGPVWTEADRRATQAFQRAQGWTGADADGLPGPVTWEYLVAGKGRDIPVAGSGGAVGSGADSRTSASASASTGTGSGSGSAGMPRYPGKAVFRPGRSHPMIERLGRQLVAKGFGRYYAQGPGPRWSESDRRNVEAFQRAQGWRGGAADGYPGPETWHRLFS
ncbi:peptidoglycan-binding protein [Streptomyces sp. NPDC002851]